MVTDSRVRFKRAFVSGGTGIVGIPLCQQLVAIDVGVTAYSRTGAKFELPPAVDHILGDISDFDSLARAVKNADLIFHVAAAVHGSVSTFSQFEAMNVGGTENVVRAARENGSRLVYVSTVNVEGFHQGVLTDDYASTKARAEDVVLSAVRDGLDAVVVRPATVFGNVPGRAGWFVDRLLAGSLKVIPGPSRLISPVWADDLGRALIHAADSGESGEIYTVAGATMSTGDFVTSISSSVGVSRPKLSIPVWAITAPLQLAWWSRKFTRWTPPASVESVRSGSIHDGTDAARELGFSYTNISEIFNCTARENRYRS
jgi:nucleoside-diphosphate-sugar epimerase